jgi:chlorite dismutase
MIGKFLFFLIQVYDQFHSEHERSHQIILPSGMYICFYPMETWNFFLYGG